MTLVKDNFSERKREREKELGLKKNGRYEIWLFCFIQPKK